MPLGVQFAGMQVPCNLAGRRMLAPAAVTQELYIPGQHQCLLAVFCQESLQRCG